MWIGIEFDFWNIGSKITLVRFFVFIFLFTSASRARCLIFFPFFFSLAGIFFVSGIWFEAICEYIWQKKLLSGISGTELNMTVKPPSVEMVELEYLERVGSGVRARRKLLSILRCNIFLAWWRKVNLFTTQENRQELNYILK